jgi:lipopolysaccharide cholinephosphotransferase
MTEQPEVIRLGPEQLEALHRVQYEMLLALDTLCNEHGIRYQVAAGTLLGAIRHKDFIPWDDDVDVIMLREHYDKFIQLSGEFTQYSMQIQAFQIDPQWKSLSARLRRKDSELRFVWDSPTGNNGIFIDVFPMDVVDTKSAIGKAHIAAIRCLRRIERIVYYPQSDEQESLKKQLINLGLWPVRLLFRAMPLRLMLQIIDVTIRLLNRRPAGDVACLTQMNPCQLASMSMKRPKSELEEIVLVNIRQHLFPAPASYETTLRRLYGDYHHIPPKSLQISHHPVVKFQLPL